MGLDIQSEFAADILLGDDDGIVARPDVARAAPKAAPAPATTTATATANRTPPRRVLHIAGHITEPVYSFIGPTLNALSRAGVHQTLVMLDWPTQRHSMPTLPDHVDVHAMPSQASSWRSWSALAQRVGDLCADGQPAFDAVHLHGLLPFVLGSRLGRLLPAAGAICFTPHGSRSMRLMHGMRGWLLRRMASRGPLQVIVNSASDAQLVSRSPVRPQLVESALGADFFDVERNEAEQPLLVSGAVFDDPRGPGLFSRMAVVLGAAELGLRFHWAGAFTPEIGAMLKAANVGCYASSTDVDLARRLSAGWVFLAAGDAREFPVMLACAMAAGLPCLAADEANHRNLIRHGETGFIYGSDEEAMALLTMLIDDGALRRKIGLAARADAAARFGAGRFHTAIEKAYALRVE